jgi:hypothetical protein
MFQLFLPVWADQTFDSICAQINTLTDKVVRGAASNDEVNQLNQLIIQRQQLTVQRIQNNSAQMSNIYSNLERLQNQNQAISNTLFGGTSAQVSPSTPLSSSGVGNPISGISVGSSGAIQGGISYTDLISNKINSLMNLAVANSPAAQQANQQVLHFNTTMQRLIASGKDAFNYLIPYRGLDETIEAANLILDEGVKVKSLSSAQFTEQRIIDDTHLQLVTAIFETAQGVGDKNQDNINKGTAALSQLVGQEQSNNLVSVLNSVSGSSLTKLDWDVNTRNEKQKQLILAAIANDSVIQEIFDRLHKYNHLPKGEATASKIIEPVLAAGSLVPTFIGPAARGALLDYVMMTGGPREDILLKETYLGERLEDRVRLITAEADMALENYQLGNATNNYPLVFTSQSLIEQMSKDSQKILQ